MKSVPTTGLTVLVIDDEHVILDLMIEILADAGYVAVGASGAEQALELLADPDVSLVVSDITMPALSGLELLDLIRLTRPSLPVVLVTGAGTHGNLCSALARGADGLVMKPFAHQDLLDAVRTALDRARRSETELRERLLTPTLAGALANAIEAREPSLQGHCERLAALAVRVAERLGLSAQQMESVRLGAILHDVGKIGIPDRVLQKPGPFSADELALMRTHPLIGDRLLEPLDLLQNVRPVVRHHHERWDGAGYPDGLVEEATPIEARIVAIADAVEAMSARRAHSAPLQHAEIVRELRHGRGSQWDPEAIDVVLALIDSGELRFGEKGLRLESHERAVEPRLPRFAVLLVDHDAGDAAQTKRILERELTDVSVAHAADLATADELCRGSTWSLVVLDHRLPDGDALELLGRLRGETPGTPVVMLTGEGSDAVALEAFRRGATDYVVKRNGYAAELATRVRTLLEAA
ncbi:MAG: response regulator [Actinomycetota bacterium]|nr:response regulator [Actinomycetota bacterium]